MSQERRYPGVAMIRGSYRTAMFRSGTPPVAVPSPILDAPSGAPVVPFRRATTEKVSQLTAEAFTAATTRTQFNRVIEENGFLYGIVLDSVAVTAANALAVTFTEDAPFIAYDSIVLADSAGELVNVNGMDLFVQNLAARQYAVDPWHLSAELFTATAGAAATGGTIRFLLRVPCGVNRRSLSGIVGNQDRATKYQLRTDWAASASIWATAPTTLPPVTITKLYEKYTVPAGEVQVGRSRIAQEQVPPDYGRLHFITANNFEASPTASTTQNHFIRRVGNTIRFIALVFRAGTGTSPRALAQANAPTRITFKIGDDTLFDETYRYRRGAMHERYGFDFPDGVLVYDMIHDFLNGAGGEIGDDYYYTQGLNNAQFQIVYPAGFTSGGSLRAITDDLQEVPVAA